MSTQTQTGAKYLESLYSLGRKNLDEFLMDSRNYFHEQDISAVCVAGDKGAAYFLEPDYQKCADDAARTFLGREFMAKDIDFQIAHIVQNPILWSHQVMEGFLNCLTKSPAKGASLVIAVGKVKGNDAEKWRMAFWKSFFTPLARVWQENGIKPLFATLVKEWDRSLPVWVEYCYEMRETAEQLRAFLHCFCGMIVSSIPDARAGKDIPTSELEALIQSSIELVGDHPYAFVQIIYPFSNQVSQGFLKKLLSKLHMQILEKRRFLTWALITEAAKALTFAYLIGDTSIPTIDDATSFVTLIKELANAVCSEPRSPSILRDGLCPFTGSPIYSDRITKNDFVCEVMQNSNWGRLAKRHPVTHENVEKIVAFVSLHYTQSWSNQFKTITTKDEFSLALEYAAEMDRINVGEWYYRDDFFEQIANSAVWKDCPTPDAVAAFEKFRSKMLFFSILKRKDGELPTNWLMLKFVHNGHKK